MAPQGPSSQPIVLAHSILAAITEYLRWDNWYREVQFTHKRGGMEVQECQVGILLGSGVGLSWNKHLPAQVPLLL